MPRPRKPVPPSPSSTVRSRLMGLGGARSDGGPDTAAIARRVGRSQRTVQRWLASDTLPRAAEAKVGELEASDARRPRWITVGDEGATGRALIGARQGRMPAVQDVRGSLLTAFARSDGSIDTRRAAAELGVSQRTVQRWAKGASRPKIEHQQGLRKAVRSSMLEGRRATRQQNRGAAVELTAVVQISSDIRVRKLGHQTGIRLSGDDMARIQEAYARGGDTAANKALGQAVARSKYGLASGLDSGSLRSISEVRFVR